MRSHRSLRTILFTDIVGSTERATELGDKAWRELLQRHHATVRRTLRRWGAREVNEAGDGFLAILDSPAWGIACAAEIRQAVKSLGLEVRGGVHMGEVEHVGDGSVGGIGVHIGARVMARAGPGEILVSRAVRDAEEGSGFGFQDRGIFELKGIRGEWRLFAVTGLPTEVARPSPLRRARARPRPVLGAALGLGLVVLMGFYLAWRDDTPVLTPEEAAAAEEAALAADADPGIAVLPFTVNNPALEIWREGMVDLFSVNLDGVPDLRAIDSRTVLTRWAESVPDTARADLATALAVARRTGARYALLGSVVGAGSDLRLTAEVYEATGGRKLGSAHIVAPADSILRLVDRLSLDVLRTMPRGEGSVLTPVHIAELTTDSLEALKAYLKGEALYRRADFQGAQHAFQRAIEVDSLFALAWSRLIDNCGWSAKNPSPLCDRDPPWDWEEFLNRLPPRRAERRRLWATDFSRGARENIEFRSQLVRKYPDDPEIWNDLGEGHYHWGQAALVDRADGVPALERSIALAPGMHAEPYIHLITLALADPDSAHISRLLDDYGRISRGAGRGYPTFRLAFELGFGDPATRARALATVDTIPAGRLTAAIGLLGYPRLHQRSKEVLRVLLSRPEILAGGGWHRGWLFEPFAMRGRLREALVATNDPNVRPAFRAARQYQLYHVGMVFPAEELARVLAEGVADTMGLLDSGYSTPLLVGAYAVDRGQWDAYAAALDLQRARARRYLAQGDQPDENHALMSRGYRSNTSIGRWHEAAARALEGYALWKRGRKAEAVPVLETAQSQTFGFVNGLATYTTNVYVRCWLGELMMELGRWRDAERYYKSVFWFCGWQDLKLGKIYQELGEYEKARESYENALLSWQDADPELQPRIEEARRALARLPKPIRRGGP